MDVIKLLEYGPHGVLVLVLIGAYKLLSKFVNRAIASMDAQTKTMQEMAKDMALERERAVRRHRSVMKQLHNGHFVEEEDGDNDGKYES